MVHNQALDEIAHGNDKILRPVDVDDGGDDIFIVFPLVVVLIIGVDELVNDVGILLGHGLADLGAGVLGGGHPAHVNEAVQGDSVPLVHFRLIAGVNFLQLFRRIVNKGGQLVPVGLGHTGGEELIHLLPHHAGGAVEDVLKGLVLPVNIGDEVLGALG